MSKWTARFLNGPLIMIIYTVRRRFLSLDSSSWNVTFCRVGRAPARVAPVRPPPGRPTCLAGRRTLDSLRTQVSRGTRCYERPGCWWPPWLGTADTFPNPWKVGIGAYSPWKVGIGASGNPSSGFLTCPNDDYSRNLDLTVLQYEKL